MGSAPLRGQVREGFASEEHQNRGIECIPEIAAACQRIFACGNLPDGRNGQLDEGSEKRLLLTSGNWLKETC